MVFLSISHIGPRRFDRYLGQTDPDQELGAEEERRAISTMPTPSHPLPFLLLLSLPILIAARNLLPATSLSNLVRSDGWLIAGYDGFPKGSAKDGGASECTGKLVGALQGKGSSECLFLGEDETTKQERGGAGGADCFVLQTFDRKGCVLVVFSEDERVSSSFTFDAWKELMRAVVGCVSAFGFGCENSVWDARDGQGD